MQLALLTTMILFFGRHTANYARILEQFMSELEIFNFVAIAKRY